MVISTLISITLIMMINPSSSMISSLLMIRRPHALSLWILAAAGTQPSAHGGRTAATIFTKIYLRQFILLRRLYQKKSCLYSPSHSLNFFTIAYFSWILFTKLGEVRTQNRCVFFTKVGAQGSAVPCLSALSSPIWTSERATTCNGSAGWKHQSQQSNFANLKIGKLLKNSLLKTDLSIRYRFLLMIEAQQVFDRGFAQRKDWSLDRFTVTSFTFILGVWVWAMFHSIFRYLLFVI